MLLRRALAPLAGRDDLEIIVVDDGSAPDQAIENRSACEAVPGCRYVRFQQSRGGAAARNQGLAASTGPMVWFLDDDDFATESTLDDVTVEVARGDARRVLLMPRATLLDGTTIRVDVPANQPDKSELYREMEIEVTTSCAIFPRWALQRIGGWDEHLPALQDTDLMLRIARVAQFACVPTEPVRVDTSHPVRITSSLVSSTVGKAMFLRKHWGTLSVRRRVRYIVQLLGCSSLTRGARLRWQLFKVRRAERLASCASLSKDGVLSSLPR